MNTKTIEDIDNEIRAIKEEMDMTDLPDSLRILSEEMTDLIKERSALLTYTSRIAYD